MKTIFYAYLVTVLVFSACSSGKSTFERGNYYEAVITSVNRLRKNDDHKKSIETLTQAYPLAVTFYQDRANIAIASSDAFKWTQVVNAYTLINTMYDEIKRCPGALRVVPNPVNYFSKLQEAKQNAAEEHYAAGILALQFGTRDKAKQAYGLFKTANTYVSGYKEVNDYMQAALNAATVKILVEPIPVHSKTVGVSAEFFNDKISEFVHSAPINEFVKFYTRAEAKKLKLNPDHIVQLQFDDFAVGQVYKHEKEIHLTKDSVVMGTYVTPTASSNQNTSAVAAGPVGKTGLVAGSGVLASAETPANPNPTAVNTAAQEQAERDRAAKELAEKRLAEQLLKEKEQAERIRAEKEAAEKQRLGYEAAERERLASEAANKAAAERTLAEKAALERAAKERAEKEAADKALAEKIQAERNAAAEKARAEKEAADKALIEKIKSEKEKAAKEKADQAEYIDPTINREDTTDVKDPVTVCHIPPGNKQNSRNLTISRAALKAHLAHGDVEGGCDQDGKHDKAKPAEKKVNEGKGSEKPKAKGPGASIKTEGKSQDYGLLFNGDEILLASAENNGSELLRYLTVPAVIVADTNKVYGTVKATLYHYSKTTTSKGVVSFKIIDAKTGALLSVEKMPGEYVWISEWATFNGDERALSAEQLRLTRLKEQPAPASQELFIEFTKPIYDQITTKIREFYKGY
jgi:hypothetical protein